MNGFEILVPLTAVVVGGAMFLVPIAGLTARFALKPVMEAFLRLREAEGGGERQLLLEQRLAHLEAQVHAMERDRTRQIEEADFRRRLEAPGN